MPLIAYLRSGTLPDGKDAARKLKVQASQFVLIRDVLYNRDFSWPYLRCLSHDEADYVMRKVHKEICENHSEARSLVHKLIRAGYYWPTMLKDAQAYVKACNKCQRFSNLIRQPSEKLTPMTAKISSSWYRLLHQMGGSITLSYYHEEEHSYICVEEHHLQVWDTEGTCFWQRKAIRQRLVQGLLYRARYKESLLISSTPAGQRTSRSHEPDLVENHQDPTRGGQRVSGLTNYQAYYGHIGWQQGHPLERTHFNLHTEPMQSSQQR